MKILPALVVAALTALAIPSQAAVPQAQVPLTFDHDCIAPLGVLLVDGDCDGGGYAFLEGDTVPKAGPLVLKGVTFTFPTVAANTNNTLVATGQTVPLAGKTGHAFLHLLAFTTDGAGAPTDSTVTYADGSKDKVKISAPDWTVTAGAVLDIAVQGPFQPANATNGRNHAYIISVPLNPKKRVVSVTLPKTTKPTVQNFGSNPANLQVFAMTLSATPTSKTGPIFN